MEHACIHLLQQAMLAGAQELKALHDGRIEQASAWEEERNRLSDYTILNDEKQALIPQLENLLNVLSAQKK